MSGKRNTVDDFCNEYSEAILEEIFDSLYKYLSTGKNSGKVYFDYVNVINATNRSAYGDYDDQFSFHIRDGNNWGSELLDYGDIDKPKVYRTVYKLIPADEALSASRPEFTASWLKAHDKKIKELEDKYNYDRYFDPADKIIEHYKEQAAIIGLKWTTKEVEVEV